MVLLSSSFLTRLVLPNTLHHRHVTTIVTATSSIYHYNTVIKSLSLYPASAIRAIYVYNHILYPDTYTFPFILKAVTRLSSLILGTQIHSQIITLGFYRNVHVSTALIQMYSNCDVGCVLYARKVFDEMPQRDLAIWNAIIAAYVKVGDVEIARSLFEGMPERNVISWTSLIVGYARAHKAKEAIFIFRRMMGSGVDPDEVAMLAVLSACSQLGELELGKWVHNYIAKNGLITKLQLNNVLIDMYAKLGDMRMAVEVFENLESRCVVTWSTMIGGLAAHGMGREALEMFYRMVRAQIKPNAITFIAVLSACSHAGLVNEGRWFFKIMESKFGIRPRIEHYGCMVDLLGRSGCLKEAEELVNKMPFRANASIWGSLLAASRVHGDVALAEKSLRNLIILEPHNSGNYMLLSNMYASHGRLDESAIMRKVMKDAGVRKTLGSSFVEVSNIFHEFSSGKKSHPEFKMVDGVLSQIAEHLISSTEMSEEQLTVFEFDAP